MSCHCAYGYEDDSDSDYCLIWKESRVSRTRKDHTCCECGDTIPAGSRCCSSFSITNEDGAQTLYRCISCATLAELVAEINKACPLWGGLSEICDYTDGVNWFNWREKVRSLENTTTATA